MLGTRASYSSGTAGDAVRWAYGTGSLFVAQVVTMSARWTDCVSVAEAWLMPTLLEIRLP
jgi:hypothetical protein